MRSKVEKLLDEVSTYSERTISDNVKERLNKTLSRYLEDLESSSDRLRGKKVHIVYKELSK